jgi:hypothetical protein
MAIISETKRGLTIEIQVISHLLCIHHLNNQVPSRKSNIKAISADVSCKEQNIDNV